KCHRRTDTGAAQADQLRAGGIVVVDVQKCAPAEGKGGSEGDVDGALAACGHTGAARVGLSEIAGVGTGEGETGDVQDCAGVVGEGNRLRLAGGTHVLIAKINSSWREAHRALEEDQRLIAALVSHGEVGLAITVEIGQCYKDRPLASRKVNVGLES